MSESEKELYKKALMKGIHGVEVYPDRISFQFNDEYIKITKRNPSSEFVKRIKELS